MAEFRFPNETDEYRRQREGLLEREVELRAQAEAVAAARRDLPLGGRLGDDYRFRRVEDGTEREVSFVDLFGVHDELLLYTMMYGEEWDAPCPSCTSIVDATNSAWYAVDSTCAIAVVAAASAGQLRDWSERRGWTIPLFSAAGTSYVLDYAGREEQNPAMVSVMNVFRRTSDGIFHAWGSELLSRPMDSGHPRHVDSIWPLWNLLDMTPSGRGDAIVPRQDFRHSYFSRVVLGEGDSAGEGCCES